MRVFLDANILFTAAYSPKGKSRFLMEHQRELSLHFFSCELAAQEAQMNLELKAANRLKDLEKLIKKIIISETVIGSKCPIDLPEKDQPIFLSALKLKCSFLLTGDKKDFGPHMNRKKETKGILIQSVSDFWSDYFE